MFCLMLLLATANPSPTLQAIVALGRGDAQIRATRAALTPVFPAEDATSPTSLAALAALASPTSPTSPTPPTPESMVVLKTAGSESVPWAGGVALLVLSGGAFALWWRKRSSPSTNVLAITQSVTIGRGRSLLVAEISGRRMLLSSSEGGVSLLVDLGLAPASASFESTMDSLLPAMAVPPSAKNVDIEGKEIQRRLAHARNSA